MRIRDKGEDGGEGSMDWIEGPPGAEGDHVVHEDLRVIE